MPPSSPISWPSSFNKNITSWPMLVGIYILQLHTIHQSNLESSLFHSQLTHPSLVKPKLLLLLQNNKIKGMGFLWLWLQLFTTFLAIPTSTSLPKHEEAGYSRIELKIHGPNRNSSVSLSYLLLQDEEHVKALSNRIAGHRRDSTSLNTTVSDVASRIESNSRGISSSSIPLNPGSGIGTGNYYVKIGIGSPPKYYSMILDTGSSLSWLQCRPCTIYCHAQVDPVFDPSASKTYKTLSCSTTQCTSLKAATLNDPYCSSSKVCLYAASYGDSSFSVGYLSQDVLTLSLSQTLPGFTYGCGQDNEGLFGRAAGIIGLSRDKLSMLAQLSTKYGYAFSYCLPSADSAAGGGGFLSIGNIPLSVPYKYTPMLTDSKNPSLYFLRLSGITVGGRALQGQNYKVSTIIDSGTVITRLPASLYTSLRQAFVNAMLAKKFAAAPAFSILDACFKGNLKSMAAAAPEVGLIFGGGAQMGLKPQNVLIEVGDSVTCFAFATTTQIAIIGNHQQQRFNVAYDVLAARIGFAPGSCH